MKKTLKVVSLVLALMLVFTSTSFAAYTVDELSGVNAPVLIRDGIDKDPAVGVNIVEGIEAHLKGTGEGTVPGTYDADADVYSDIPFIQYSNLLTFRQSDGLQYELGNKYVVSFDISVSAAPSGDTLLTFMRYNGTGGSGRTDSASIKIVVPASVTLNTYRHVEFVYDLTGATARDNGSNDFGLWVSEGGAANGTVNIANFRIEKYVPSTPATNLLGKTTAGTNMMSEYKVDATGSWTNLIGWKDGEGVDMRAGRKYKFSAQLDIPAALNATKQLRITRAAYGGSWTGRSNTYSTILQIPSNTSGIYNVEMILDFTNYTEITGTSNYNGLLFVAESAIGQTIVVSNPQLVDITEEFAVYQNVDENILPVPLTVDDAKYTGTSIPSSMTLTKLANSPNAVGWEYTDEFKLVQGKKYTLSFDWSVPSTTDTDRKTINWALSDADPNADYKGWTGRGDYIARDEVIRAYVSQDSLSGSVTYDFVYNPTDVSKGIVLWVTSASTAATQYTLSNVKIAPTFEEIDIQQDGNEIVVIQNEKTANAFDDVIILAEYDGDTLKNFDFTTPETIAEKNTEGTIALRAKINVEAGSTVKMFRWEDFSSIKPVTKNVDVK